MSLLVASLIAANAWVGIYRPDSLEGARVHELTLSRCAGDRCELTYAFDGHHACYVTVGVTLAASGNGAAARTHADDPCKLSVKLDAQRGQRRATIESASRECEDECGVSAGIATKRALTRIDMTPYQPSFDCAKARAPVEVSICDSFEASRLDRAIASDYGAVAKAGGPLAAELKASQKAWLPTRLECAKGAPRAGCLTENLERRSLALDALRRWVLDQPGTTGTRRFAAAELIDHAAAMSVATPIGQDAAPADAILAAQPLRRTLEAFLDSETAATFLASSVWCDGAFASRAGDSLWIERQTCGSGGDGATAALAVAPDGAMWLGRLGYDVSARKSTLWIAMPQGASAADAPEPLRQWLVKARATKPAVERVGDVFPRRRGDALEIRGCLTGERERLAGWVKAMRDAALPTAAAEVEAYLARCVAESGA